MIWPIVLLIFVCLKVSALEELDETIINAEPLENARLRHESKGDITEGLYSDLKTQNIILGPSNGRLGLSIRGSNAADRVYHIYKKAPLHLGDGSGPLSDLFGRHWLDSYSLLSSPAGNLVGNGSLSGSLQLHKKQNTKNNFELYGNTLGTQSIVLRSPLKNQGQLGIEITKRHGSYDHKSGLGYDKGRLRNNDLAVQKLSFFNQVQWADYEIENLFLLSHAEGTNPEVNSQPKNPFQRKSAFYSLSAEKKYQSFFQAYYLLSDNENKQVGFASDLKNQKYGLIAERSDYLYNRLIVNSGLSAETLEAKNTYSSGELDKSHSNLDTYINFNYPYRSWMIEPQFRYLWRYDSLIKSLHLTKATYESAFWLSYAEGFRAPSLNDLFFNSSLSLANPDLEPEESQQIEVGYKKESYQIKIFFIEYQNLFQYIEDSGRFQAQNLDYAKAYGVEAEYIYKKLLHEAKIQVALQNSEGKDKTSLDLTPKWQALIYYSYFWGPTAWSIYTKTWQDYYINGEKASSWTTLNLAVESMGFKNIKAKLKWENILEKQITFTKGYPEALGFLSLHFSYSF